MKNYLPGDVKFSDPEKHEIVDDFSWGDPQPSLIETCEVVASEVSQEMASGEATRLLEPIEPNRNISKLLDKINLYDRDDVEPPVKEASAQLAHRVVYQALFDSGLRDFKLSAEIPEDEIVYMARKQLIWTQANKRATEYFTQLQAKFEKLPELEPAK